jgi:hypothetical protein
MILKWVTFLCVTDANTYATGDLSMKGLPYIDKTIITFNNATVSNE